MRGVGRAAREKGDIARAASELEVQRRKLVELERLALVWTPWRVGADGVAVPLGRL